MFDAPNFWVALQQNGRYVFTAMRRTQKHIGAQALLALFLGLFWLAPNVHSWAVIHETGENVSCRTVSGCGAHESDASEEPSEPAHDSDNCSICRLAALPYALHIYPNPHRVRPYSAPERTSPVRAEFISIRYEGFSFGARAPPTLRT